MRIYESIITANGMRCTDQAIIKRFFLSKVISAQANTSTTALVQKQFPTRLGPQYGSCPVIKAIINPMAAAQTHQKQHRRVTVLLVIME
uniref:Uncharacterized protein n=1 Tax=Xenopus tropicalis TaxID=8364 RepID=A0A1B8Y8V6_XENTR